MKKLLIVALCVLMCFGLASCTREVVYDTDYSDGYSDGLAEAQNQISVYAEECLWDISYDAKKDYGISPEEALQILANYADGEPVPEENLHKAIWAMHQFYYDVSDLIYELDEYLVN